MSFVARVGICQDYIIRSEGVMPKPAEQLFPPLPLPTVRQSLLRHHAGTATLSCENCYAIVRENEFKIGPKKLK